MCVMETGKHRRGRPPLPHLIIKHLSALQACYLCVTRELSHSLLPFHWAQLFSFPVLVLLNLEMWLVGMQLCNILFSFFFPLLEQV